MAVLLMVYNMDVTWEEVAAAARRAGIWLPACLLLWLVIYLMNAWAWSMIIRLGVQGESVPGMGFWRTLKYTITGYALNYVTPAGVLGGEPYRIMELKPFLGTERAVSSVLLNSMMHIFSHFCFWAFSIVLFVLTYYSRMTWGVASLLLLFSLFVGAGIHVFIRAYNRGVAEKSIIWLTRLPLVGSRLDDWLEGHQEMLRNIDCQIKALRKHSPRTFMATFSLEFFARVLGCLELQFILFVFTDRVALTDCIIMQGFTSLLGNIIFFIPMQVGVREAAMAIFANFCLFNGAYGVLTSLIVRIREIVWISIGMALLKTGNMQAVPQSQSNISTL
ncbi:MAG: lysylphosphatidylglycerol synthase transmembrane domain-containing protein [Bacteroidaceae bacterium]